MKHFCAQIQDIFSIVSKYKGNFCSSFVISANIQSHESNQQYIKHNSSKLVMISFRFEIWRNTQYASVQFLV